MDIQDVKGVALSYLNKFVDGSNIGHRYVTNLISKLDPNKVRKNYETAVGNNRKRSPGQSTSLFDFQYDSKKSKAT